MVVVDAPPLIQALVDKDDRDVALIAGRGSAVRQGRKASMSGAVPGWAKYRAEGRWAAIGKARPDRKGGVRPERVLRVPRVDQANAGLREISDVAGRNGRASFNCDRGDPAIERCERTAGALALSSNLRVNAGSR